MAALGSAYPVIQRIIGEENFRVLAGSFVRSRPPQRPQLSLYGADFAEFIAAFAPAQRDYPFLADLARLEWALHESYFARDADPFDAQALAAIPGERLPQTCFALHPAVRLVQSSRYPIWQIWSRENSPEANAGGEAVLVARPSGRVEAYPLQPGEQAFLAAIAMQACLAQAAEAALAAEPGFDLSAALAACLPRSVFAGLA
jgi:hypothetical protein